MKGWILDVYPVPQGLCVWMLDDAGRAFSFLDEWSPLFYLKSTNDLYSSHFIDSLEKILSSHQVQAVSRWVEKKDFFTNGRRVVLEVRMAQPGWILDVYPVPQGLCVWML
ncbi:MAG: hypothetical protein LHV69_11000, partial [Elusimicrobia bacterium]|nr:hypothetical protein [Candidatus Obscuribacterium magneticum]